MGLLSQFGIELLPAQVNGGGIGADEGHVKLWLSQCEFLSNKAREGGAIALLGYLKSAEAEISFCSFKSNIAHGVRLHAYGHSHASMSVQYSPPPHHQGGDTRRQGTTVPWHVCLLSRICFETHDWWLAAVQSGGALDLSGSSRASLTSCQLTSNRAGVVRRHGTTELWHVCLLSRICFEAHNLWLAAVQDGGALVLSGSSRASLTSCQLTSNEARMVKGCALISTIAIVFYMIKNSRVVQSMLVLVQSLSSCPAA